MACIIKRPNRPLPWLVMWREPDTKQRKAKSFKTKKEADDFRDMVSQDLRHGTYRPLKPIPFKTWAEGWLERRRPAVSSNTIAQYEWAVCQHLVPHFGRTPIQNLRAEQIEAWQATLLQAGTLRPRTAQILGSTLGAILEDAVQKDYLRQNPMKKVERFAVPERELCYLTVEQLGVLVEKAGHLYGVLFLTMGLCGLRIGEAAALQWPDLDLAGGRLFVRRQLSWRRKQDCKAGEPRWAFAELKSEAGTRVVEPPPVLVPFLEAHREQQQGTPNPHGLVFCTTKGTPLDVHNVRRRHFQPALQAMGLAGVGLRDLRQTFIANHVEAWPEYQRAQTKGWEMSCKVSSEMQREAGRLLARLAVKKYLRMKVELIAILGHQLEALRVQRLGGDRTAKAKGKVKKGKGSQPGEAGRKLGVTEERS